MFRFGVLWLLSMVIVIWIDWQDVGTPRALLEMKVIDLVFLVIWSLPLAVILNGTVALLTKARSEMRP